MSERDWTWLLRVPEGSWTLTRRGRSFIVSYTVNRLPWTSENDIYALDGEESWKKRHTVCEILQKDRVFDKSDK